MSRTQEISHEQVDAIGRCQALQPRESEFIGKRGYKRTYRPDGGYEWRYRYTTNVNGKMTREAGEVLEMLRPFSKADTERHQNREAKKERAKLRDRNGAVCFVDPERADDAARRNGWAHVWSARGVRVAAGPDGMLFRLTKDWEPLGVRCLGTPLHGSALVPRRGVQHDPDGNPWRWIAGAWRRVA